MKPHPIGPLAIALRLAEAGPRRLTLLAAIMTALLLIGVGLLIAR